MAAVVLIIKESQAREREVAAQRVKNDAAFAKDVLQRFNKSKSNTLNYEELRSWLKAILQSQMAVSTARARKEMEKAFPGSTSALMSLPSSQRASINGQFTLLDDQCDVVTDDEVDWVIMMAMDKSEKGSFKRLVKEKKINSKEIELHPCDFGGALQAWLCYIHNKPILKRAMAKYGTNDRGQMARDHVKSMLQDLSGGREPEESEVDWVIQEAAAMPHSNGISGPEIIKVLSLWYVKDLERETLQQSPPAEVVEQKQCGSGICCVS